MKNEIDIAGRKVGARCEPFVIAELSGNHNQSLERALAIIDAAAASGAHALKLQTYTADTLTIDKKDGDFYLDNPDSLWHGMSMYELYQQAYTPWEWHETLFARCKKLGLICFSSPFDVTAVDFLEALNCPCYKIGSTENTDVALLQKVAATGKPVIISTGMATVAELGDMVNIVRNAGCQDLVLLKCTAAYPADPADANLLTIPHMQELLECQIGLSDHTMGIGVAVASVALGVTVIEKHFTLSRDEGGVDAAFSMEPNEFQALISESKVAWLARGQVHYGTVDSENSSLSRRSLYIVQDMQAGDVLNPENLRSIRPGYGLPTRHLEDLLGMRVTQSIERGTRMSWDLVK
jgi:N-acetylneuraminate synthase